MSPSIRITLFSIFNYISWRSSLSCKPQPIRAWDKAVPMITKLVMEIWLFQLNYGTQLWLATGEKWGNPSFGNGILHVGGLLEAVVGFVPTALISCRVLLRQKGATKFCFYCWLWLFFLFTLSFILWLVNIHHFQKRNLMNLAIVTMES